MRNFFDGLGQSAIWRAAFFQKNSPYLLTFTLGEMLQSEHKEVFPVKIKEVIAQTGLTDRAIRLYIENGLVSPENQKSYTGRNHYAFTQKDVQLLNQIAILRKADFSIEQIKILQNDGEAAWACLQQYLDSKRKAITDGQKMVAALETLAPRNIQIMDSICSTIEHSLGQSTLPEEDRNYLLEEDNERCVIWMLTVIALLPSFMGIPQIIDDLQRVYLRFYREWKHYSLPILVAFMLVMAVVMYSLYRKPIRDKARQSIRKTVAIMLLVVMFLAGNLFCMGIAALFPMTYSETRDSRHYLLLNQETQHDQFSKLFPAEIPGGTRMEDIAYHYRMEYPGDPLVHLYAQWTLLPGEETAELERITEAYEGAPVHTSQWRGWKIWNFTEEKLYASEAEYRQAHPDSVCYCYLIYAYHEEYNLIRYIASYSNEPTTELPYYLWLEW